MTWICLNPPARCELVVKSYRQATISQGCGGERNPSPSGVANTGTGGDNRSVDHSATAERLQDDPFCPRTLVIVTLSNPREKFWGAILALRQEGLSLCGIELPSFEDLVSMVKEGEPVAAGVVFFPMHRVERMELDLPDGNIPSLAEKFTASTGRDPIAVLTRSAERAASPGERS